MSNIKQTDLTMLINDNTFINYYNRLKLIAISLFTWKGLDEIAGYGAGRFMEMNLFDYGRSYFYKDDKLGYTVLRVNPNDKYNVYNLPTKVMLWSIGYEKSNVAFDDGVYVMNNELEMPTKETIDLMSYRLYEVERTIDNNLIAMKTPILIEGDAKTILTLKNVYMQYSGNVPFVSKAGITINNEETWSRCAGGGMMRQVPYKRKQRKEWEVRGRRGGTNLSS